MSDQLADFDCRHNRFAICDKYKVTNVIFSYRAKKQWGLRGSRQKLFLFCHSQYCCGIWEWEIRTPPRLPSCCITHSRQIICPLRFLRIYFSPHMMFYSWCGCHLSARVRLLQTDLFATGLACCLKQFYCSRPKKICSGVMQIFWFTSTGGHKLMYSLVSGLIPQVTLCHSSQSSLLWLSYLFNVDSTMWKSRRG